jgi:menaquinone-specific isochorismate synthase
MLPFEIDGRTYFVNPSRRDLPPLDLISWLANSSRYPKVFWKERDGKVTRAAVGNLFSFPRVPGFSGAALPEMRLYGGVRFADFQRPEDGTWRGFPRACFWLPEIEVSQEGEKTEAIFYDEKEFVSFPSNPPKNVRLAKRIDLPNFAQCKKNVELALQSMDSGQCDKIVLARKTTLQFSQPVSLWNCLNHLVHKTQEATLFAFQLSPSVGFLGATPERLFERKKDLLCADALAGTRLRGTTAEEEIGFERDLLQSDKEQREFQIVKDFLHRSLSPICKEMKWDGTDRILKATHVQHIHNRLEAILESKICDEALVDALHPTPALGGNPRDKAMAFLEQIEPFDRGWYGGLVGVIAPQSANLHVAIRSALIRECAVHLFAGTGIVEGSDAMREWEELEQKIRPFTELFI